MRAAAPASMLVFALAACGPPLCPEYSAGLFARAGESYELTYAHETAEDPLAPMAKPAVIIKADDLRAVDKKYFARLMAVMARRRLPVSMGLIAKSLLEKPQDHLACLANYPSGLVEVWNHGYDHKLGEDVSEFQRSGLEHQIAHLREAQALVKKYLNIEMRTFGAPGNATDTDTPAALAAFPEIRAHLFGGPVEGKIVFPHTIDLEAPIFHVVAPEDFSRALAAEREKWRASGLPLTLQAHPKKWDPQSWARFEQILELLEEREGARFTTPIGEARWLEDREAIAVEKMGPARYRLDLGRAKHEHVLKIAGEVLEVRRLASRDAPEAR